MKNNKTIKEMCFDGRMEERIKKTFNSEGCIICSLLRDDEFELLCKWVGNREKEEFKQRLLITKGFCNHHFFNLEKLCDPLGLTQLEKLLLQEFLREAERTDKEKTEWLIAYRQQQYNLSDKNICPICEVLSRNESEYIRHLTNFLKDRNNMKLYHNSGGLCTPHFIKIYSFLEDKDIKDKLFDIQKRHIRILLEALSGFVNKKDARWKRTEDENKSYIRGLLKLSGREGTKWR